MGVHHIQDVPRGKLNLPAACSHGYQCLDRTIDSFELCQLPSFFPEFSEQVGSVCICQFPSFSLR